MSRSATFAAAALACLAGCNAAPTNQSNETSASAPTFRAIAGDGVFAMIIPAEIVADQLATAAREQCGQREFCQVHGWLSDSDAARAMPMTDREVSTQAFQYAHNRSTGFEQRLWDCGRWPRQSKDECLSTGE